MSPWPSTTSSTHAGIEAHRVCVRMKAACHFSNFKHLAPFWSFMMLYGIQLGAVKFVLSRHQMHLNFMHPVTSENRFHCARFFIHLAGNDRLRIKVARDRPFCYSQFYTVYTCLLPRTGCCQLPRTGCCQLPRTGCRQLPRTGCCQLPRTERCQVTTYRMLSVTTYRMLSVTTYRMLSVTTYRMLHISPLWGHFQEHKFEKMQSCKSVFYQEKEALLFIVTFPCLKSRTLSDRKIDLQTPLSSRWQLELNAGKPFTFSSANQTPRQELRTTPLLGSWMTGSTTSEG